MKPRSFRLQLSCSLLLLSFSFPFTASATTLHEALSIIYKTHPALQLVRTELAYTKEEKQEAFGHWRPSLSLSYERGEGTNRIGDLSRDVTLDTRSIDFIQPLFKGGHSYYSLKKAEDRIGAAQFRLRESEQHLLLEGVEQYIAILEHTQILELSRENITIFDGHLEKTRADVLLGRTTHTDLAQSKANLALAKSQEIEASGNLSIAESHYRRLIDQNTANLLFPEDLPELHDDLSLLKQYAEAEHPTLKALALEEEAAKKDIRIKQAQLLPQIDFIARKSQQKGNVFSGGNDLDNDSFTLNFSIPIYQGGNSYTNIRRAKLGAIQAKYQRDDQKRIILDQLTSQYYQYKTTEASIAAQEASFHALKDSLEGVRAEHAKGIRTTLDLLDAERDVFEARTTLTRLHHQHIVDHYTLLAAIGRLHAGYLELETDF